VQSGEATLPLAFGLGSWKILLPGGATDAGFPGGVDIDALGYEEGRRQGRDRIPKCDGKVGKIERRDEEGRGKGLKI
jgi:hypothetical protein